MELHAELGEELAHGLGAADFLEDARSLLAALLDEVLGHQGDHEVGSHELGLLVHEHHAVGVAVIDDADIGLLAGDELLEGLDVLGYERVGLVVRETAVDLVEDVCGAVAEDLPGEQA